MRPLLLVAILAIGLTACGDRSSSNGEGAAEMTDLSAIRDVWDFNDPAASETRFRELAAEAEAAGNDAYAAEAMTQVARTYSLRREFDQANAVLDEVDNGPQGQVPVVRVRSLLERGRSLNSSGNSDAAAPLFEQAWELASQEGEGFLAGDAIHMLGIVGGLEQEQHWINVLVQYVTDDPGNGADYWLAAMHNNLGWTYFFAEDFANAEAQFIASRAAYEAQGNKRYEVLIADYSIGRAMRMQGNCEGALGVQERAYAALREEFDTEDEYVAEEIALCRVELGDREGAIGPATIAYTKFSQDAWFVENEAERLEVLRELSGN